MRIVLKVALFSFIAISIPTFASASVSSGTIQSSDHFALVCHDPTCTSPTPGVVNFFPANSTAPTISDGGGLQGFAWGNELGWINLSPAGAGVSINSTTGALSGYAWSQVSGWINFQPTGYGVSINSSGQFTGWAWTGGPNGGWIKFDCSNTNSCVTTDWRPLSQRGSPPVSTIPTGGGGTISGCTGNCSPAPATTDVCPNLPGVQTVLPNVLE